MQGIYFLNEGQDMQRWAGCGLCGECGWAGRTSDTPSKWLDG